MSDHKNDSQHPHTDHNIQQGQEPKKGQSPNDVHNVDPKHRHDTSKIGEADDQENQEHQRQPNTASKK